MKVILALDAGTTNVKAILVDRQANVLARSSVPLTIDFPKSGWVEQSAKEVWDAARQALEGCLAQGGGHEVVALGISNQRETLVAWNRSTGEPVAPCIVWQCRRSAEICDALRQRGLEDTQSLAKELAPDNITVNAFCPGIIGTDPTTASESTAGKFLLDWTRPLGG